MFSIRTPSRERMLRRPVIVLMVALVTSAGCRREASVPGAASAATRVVRDVRGSAVTIPFAVRRIVSLAPNVTEMLFAIGAGDRLVGVTRYCTYPPAALAVPRMGDLQTPDYERLVAAHPDLVVMTATGNLPQAYDKLRALDISVYLVDPSSLDRIGATMEDLGRVLDREPAAEAAADSLRAGIAAVRDAARARTPIDAVIVLGLDPLVVVGNGFLDEALTAAGGRNVLHNDLMQYPRPGREAVLAHPPAVFVVPSDVCRTATEFWGAMPDARELQRAGSRAVIVDADALLRPGPRIVEGLRALFAALH